jgi:NAD(P)-dependent dehydrogenase (short-subunit alcohol dehydrogenase family)
MTTTLILSVSSDIGAALAHRRREQGGRVLGTFRTVSEDVRALERSGVTLVEADFADEASVARACEALRREVDRWDELIVAPGTLEPVGLFADADFGAWERSLAVNLVRPLQAVHALLPARGEDALVLFFAGGGTQRATSRVSAYTLAKIALIKATELLQAEIPDARFCILGPGWVKTKIHQETLRAGEQAGDALVATRDRLARDDFVPMEDVLDCIDWVASEPVDVVGGRNFSVAHDPWRDRGYADWIRAHPDRARLRRSGNVPFTEEASRD